jgi:hypothetical protein
MAGPFPFGRSIESVSSQSRFVKVGRLPGLMVLLRMIPLGNTNFLVFLRLIFVGGGVGVLLLP